MSSAGAQYTHAHDEAVQFEAEPARSPDEEVQMRLASAAARQGQRGEVAAAVQRRGGGDSTAGVHQAAAAGLAGSAGSLPHLGAIQQSFGRHDVSGVAAHVGGPAAEANAALGSQAYATGNAVAFKGQPDLHTAAHEAAHIVQQRSGVSLKGGVGQAGDPYEQHADAVADQVVQGKSAEDLLTRGPGGGSGPAASGSGPSVQHLQFRGEDGAGRAVQFDDPPGGGTAPANAQGQGQDQGPGLVTGEYTQVQLQASIPTPIAGLRVEVTITGKYATGSERGTSFIEAEGTVRVALSYRLLFLNLSVYLQGGLKFKVQNTEDWQTAFNAAFEDISHWVAARELADLPGKKREVQQEYSTFETAVYAAIGSLRGESGSDRAEELGEESRPVLWWNSQLANLVDARNELVENVREIFSDMNGSIVGNQVYPSTTWMRDQITPHLDHNYITDNELSAVRNAYIREASSRKTTIGGHMDAIPAISNNPDVEFEGNLQVGFEAGISITENTSATINLAVGQRISDQMNATTFDTSTQRVWTAALQISGKVRSADARGQLSYEGVGDNATDPEQFKVNGQVLAGINAEEQDPSAYSSNLQSVKNRLMRAGGGARAGGQGVLSAIGTSIKREMADNSRAQWSQTASSMAGFAVELKFKKQGGEMTPDGGKVEFVTVQSVGGSMGVFSGSIERGQSVGVTW